jgi:hypothetical protein
MENKIFYARIFLQDNGEFEGVTWCRDKINDDDVEYLRSDLYDYFKKIEKSATDFVNSKGRYNSEIRMKELINLIKSKVEK